MVPADGCGVAHANDSDDVTRDPAPAGPAGLEALYRQHRQGLFTLALSVTRCPVAAEDAVHDAFVRLCREDFPPSRAGDPVAYVFGVVRNAAIDALRRGGPPRTPVSIFDAAPSPEALALGAERERSVAEAVESLPIEQREAVILKVYAGLSFAQIAAAVGAPLPTVASRYRRGLARLRERLGRLV